MGAFFLSNYSTPFLSKKHSYLSEITQHLSIELVYSK